MLLNQTFLTVFLGLVFAWLAILSALFYRLAGHYRKLTRGVTKKDLKSVLDKLLKDLDKDSKSIETLVQNVSGLKKDSFYNLQKIGLVRFNPFAETGGDQSFSLAVLDRNDSGFVVSSLHSREVTRLYAKPIKKGKPAKGFELSNEEIQAIKRAKKAK